MSDNICLITINSDNMNALTGSSDSEAVRTMLSE